MRKTWFTMYICLITLLFSGFITLTNAEDLNYKVRSGQLIQKVDAFEVIFDSTLSMNDMYKSNTKLNQEKSLVTLFNDTIPNLRLNAAARAFGQFKPYGDTTTKLLFGPSEYSKSALPDAIAPFTTGSGFSPLDAALDGATADLQSQTGQLAVIAFSDGEDMEKYSPVASAQKMKGAYGDRICIYTVQIGDSATGGKILQKVADAGQCGFMVMGDSISSPEAMADFVEKVLLKKKSAEAMREAKMERKAAPVMKEKQFTIELNVQFATGKSAIQPKYHKEIKKLADFMKQYPETKAVIEGHTDNVGKEAANVKLSQNRANSIKNYMVKKFNIDAARLEAVGYGPNKPVAGNDTAAGRQKNRRVTAVIDK